MPRTTYNAEFKAKVVLEVIQGDAELGRDRKQIRNQFQRNSQLGKGCSPE